MTKAKVLLLSIALITTPQAHATATAGKIVANSGKIAKLGKGGWVGVAVQLALSGAGWIIEEGQKPLPRKEQADEATTTTTNTTTNELAPNTQYPFEYIIDNQSFSSAEDAHQYVLTTLLGKKGLVRSRQSDGLYYDKLHVYYGHFYIHFEGRWRNSSTGYFVSEVQAIEKEYFNDKKATGQIYKFEGDIFKKGTLSEKETTLSDDYKAQREAAAKEIAKQIAQGLDVDVDVDAKSLDKIIEELEAAAKEQAKAKDTTEAKEQEKTDEKTQEEQAKDKLPDFCVFAKPLCDFLDWFKKEPPAPELSKTIPKANLSDLGLQDNIDKQRIDFVGTCPAKEMTFTLRGQTINEAIPMSYFCNLLERIAPWLVGFTYLSCIVFIVRSV